MSRTALVPGGMAGCIMDARPSYKKLRSKQLFAPHNNNNNALQQLATTLSSPLLEQLPLSYRTQTTELHLRRSIHHGGPRTIREFKRVRPCPALQMLRCAWL